MVASNIKLRRPPLLIHRLITIRLIPVRILQLNRKRFLLQLAALLIARQSHAKLLVHQMIPLVDGLIAAVVVDLAARTRVLAVVEDVRGGLHICGAGDEGALLLEAEEVFGFAAVGVFAAEGV